MKIIAGKYKGRNIPTIKDASYRPTTGKLREALFNILLSNSFRENILSENTRVLDLYSGTGSLGFEALSRGAKSVTFVDNDYKHLKSAKEFAQEIGEEENTTFLQVNASCLSYSSYNYDLVFADPPYHKNLLNKTLLSLQSGNWLKEGAIIIVEIAKLERVSVPGGMEVLLERKYNKSKLVIMMNNLKPQVKMS